MKNSFSTYHPVFTLFFLSAVFFEKKTGSSKTEYVELTEELENELMSYIQKIEELVGQAEMPEVLNKASCKKCAYYEYCYI